MRLILVCAAMLTGLLVADLHPLQTSPLLAFCSA